MLITWERAESLQEVHCAVDRMASCSGSGVDRANGMRKVSL